ncbi:hypothetical protein QE152_g24505 [Popillia japonica]|uniref:Uncharacterized protein n=1 Tax=Popillia japonica TaxID=7064 RepID=A0AAW1KE65_POPJA
MITSMFANTNLEKQWSPARVIGRTNKYSYKVVTNDGVERRRHADHIRERHELLVVRINIRIKLLPTMVSREDDMLITFGNVTTIYHLLMNRL